MPGDQLPPTVPTTGPVYTVTDGTTDFVCPTFAELADALAYYKGNNCKGAVLIQWDDCTHVDDLPEPNFGGLGRGGGVRLTTGIFTPP